MGKMKIAIESYGNKYSVELTDDATCYDVLVIMLGVLRLVGYHEDNIDDSVVEYVAGLEDVDYEEE